MGMGEGADYSCTHPMTHIQNGNGIMHTDTDKATYYNTMSRLTGHSVRYLKVRTCVRLAVATMAVCIPFASILIEN